MRPSVKKFFFISVFFLLFVVVVICAVPVESLARAGGGGGGGRGAGGGFFYIGLVLFAIYSAIFLSVVTWKYRQSAALLQKLKSVDHLWDPQVIEHQIQAAFFKVQAAWQERDPSMAADFMSDSLLKDHRRKTENMKKRGLINVLEDLKLLKTKVVQVSDYEDTNKDSFWAYIEGEATDYVIFDKKYLDGPETSDGDDIALTDCLWGRDDEPQIGERPDSSDAFTELWKFIRDPQKGWIVDMIEPKAKILEIAHFHSFSEKLHDRPHPMVEKLRNVHKSLDWKIDHGPEGSLSMKPPAKSLVFGGLMYPIFLFAGIYVTVILDDPEMDHITFLIYDWIFRWFP